MARGKPSDARLRNLISEAIADAHDEEEAVMGFAGMIQEKVSCPFAAQVAGKDVQVTDFVEGEGTDLLAVCVREGREYRIPVAAIEWAGKRVACVRRRSSQRSRACSRDSRRACLRVQGRVEKGRSQ